MPSVPSWAPAGQDLAPSQTSRGDVLKPQGTGRAVSTWGQGKHGPTQGTAAPARLCHPGYILITGVTLGNEASTTTHMENAALLSRKCYKSTRERLGSGTAAGLPRGAGGGGRVCLGRSRGERRTWPCCSCTDMSSFLAGCFLLPFLFYFFNFLSLLLFFFYFSPTFSFWNKNV